MHLISLSVAMAARQLLVPTITAALTLSATDVVSVLPVPALETQPPFIFGPGPVIVSFDTEIISMEPTKRPFTLGHGPVVVAEPTPVIPAVPSTLVTVVETASADVTRSKSARAMLAIDGHPRHFEALSEECHGKSNRYVYFTIVSPDGSPAFDSKGEKALHYVKTRWLLSYPEILRETLFNDPEISPTCPHGHCLSTTIPGTDLLLEYVRNPRVFRAGWHDGQCRYLDGMQQFSRLAVPLGDYGYLFPGSVPQVPVLDFVEQQILKTYPVLEISLIAGCTAGLFSLFVFFVPIATYGYFILGDLYWEFSRVMGKLLAGTKKASRKAVVAVSDRTERCKMRVQEMFRSTGQKEHVQTCDDAYSDPEPTYVRDLNVPPPAYTFTAPTRVFVTLELGNSREYPGSPY